MAARPRFSGSAEELAQILAPFVKTANWLKYGEKFARSPVQVPTLVAHKVLIQTLTSACNNLAFTKETVTAAFNIIAAEKKFSVLSKDTLITDWCDVMCAQVRTLCRHVAHARVQKKPPKWLRHIDGMAGDIPETGSQDSAALGGTEAQLPAQLPEGQGHPTLHAGSGDAAVEVLIYLLGYRFSMFKLVNVCFLVWLLAIVPRTMRCLVERYDCKQASHVETMLGGVRLQFGPAW